MIITFAAFVFGVICGVWCVLMWLAAKTADERMVAEEVFAQELADSYETREARRVERPLYERSTAGVVFRDKQ